MISLRMTFTGTKQATSRMKALGAAASRDVSTRALLAGGELIRAEVERNAPREPGKPDLADHIVMEPYEGDAFRPEGEDSAAVGIGVPQDFFYDLFLEFGTRRMSAQPFWRPAFAATGDAALETIRTAYVAMVDEALAKGGPA